MLRFINTNEPGDDDFSIRLSRLVERLKENEIFRQEYAAMNIHDRDIIRETKRETKIEDAVTVVRKYKASPEEVAKDFDIPLEKLLEALKEE